MAPFQLDTMLGLGVLELGIFASSVLCGILLLQVYIYYVCSADRVLVKILVAIILVLEICHTVATIHAIYSWTVTLARVAEKPGTVAGLSWAMVLETLITFLVQAYFIERVHRFSKNAWLCALVALLCVLRLISGVALSVESFLNLEHEPDYFSLQKRLGWLLTATFTLAASVDVSVAVALCVYVHRWKSAPAMKSTSQLIHRVMFWSIQTGLITSFVSVTVIICLQTMPDNYVWIGVFSMLGKLYSNSFLASLNIRSLHRKLDTQCNTFALFSGDSIDGTRRPPPRDVEFADLSHSTVDGAPEFRAAPDTTPTPKRSCSSDGTKSGGAPCGPIPLDPKSEC